MGCSLHADIDGTSYYCTCNGNLYYHFDAEKCLRVVSAFAHCRPILVIFRVIPPIKSDVLLSELNSKWDRDMSCGLLIRVPGGCMMCIPKARDQHYVL